MFGVDSEIYRRLARFVADQDNGVVFAEQNCMILERLLIEAAGAGSMDATLTVDQRATVMLAHFRAASVAGAASEQAQEGAKTPADFLAFFIQNGAYNSKRQPLGEIARAIELFERFAGREDLQVDGCPIDEWMLEDYSFTLEEQLRLGFALSATAKCWDDNVAAFRPHTEPENFDDLLLKLDLLDRREKALDLISATRATLQDEFQEAGTSATHLAWEVRPFMRYPFLRTAADGLILMSPKAMQSWLTDGVYHRLLTSAQKRAQTDDGKTSNLFSMFAGGLLEAYALEQMKSVYPGERPPGGGRIHGEQPYGGKGGEKKTSDIAVDLGTDLILFEISGSRLRADTVIIGDPEGVEHDLKRMIITKVQQLDKCISALISGEAEIPDVDLSVVRRIWPVLVTAGEITQADPVWKFIDKHAGDRLNQAKVQPLTLLDVEDYDNLCGLIEDGHALPRMLAQKTGPEYRRRELAAWLGADPKAPAIGEPSELVRAAFERAVERLVASIDFTKGIQPVVVDSDSTESGEEVRVADAR